MTNKKFSERLAKELDTLEVPSLITERAAALSKLVHISKFQAQALLEGSLRPNEVLLALIAKELDVEANWLIGEAD